MVSSSGNRYSSAGSVAGLGPSTGSPALLRKASTSSLRSSTGPSTSTPTLSRRASTHFTPLSVSPSRRTSMNMMPSPLRHSSTSPERPLPTATSVANEYFAAELEALHAESDSTQQAETVVILHDACYGHRFSRPRTNRSALSTIVERPERIQAGALGVAMAYVRLGERHADGRHPPKPTDNGSSDLPRSKPFCIRKTTRKVSLMSPAVTNVHGAKWMEELKMMCETAEMKLAMGEKELKRPEMHRDEQGEPPKFHDGDLYLCAESLDALEGSLGAVCEAVDAVFSTTSRRAFVAVRPPGHHCSASYPSGFCWVNNVHVGIMHGALSHGLTHAAIIDFDLHHGDGSQSIAWAHNSKGHKLPRNSAAWRRTSIGYFSIHDINSYPCEDGDDDKVRNASLCIENAHGQNVWNVHLQSWKTEADFWALYETRYSVILEKTRVYLRTQADRLRALNQIPKAAIFFSAGFDASEWESAGMQRHNVNVPTEFYARLTQDVIRISAEEGLGVDGRVVSVLEGGYSDRALISGVCSHLCGLVTNQTTQDRFTAPVTDQMMDGLATEMSRRMGLASGPADSTCAPPLGSVHAYDPRWWSGPELDRLDTPAAPPPPAQGRHFTPPSYCSPTAASTAKAIDPAHFRRSLSSMAPSRPYSPAPVVPIPDVPWFVAARELSKLLIPTDRTVDSCMPEELNAEASRSRRDRQLEIMHSAGMPLPSISDVSSVVSAAPSTVMPQPVRISTRERKTVKPYGSEEPAPRVRRGRNASTASVASSVAPSVASPYVARPDSSASIRPQSSISVRSPPPTNLVIKKTRPPAVATARAPRGAKKIPSPLPSPALPSPRTASTSPIRTTSFPRSGAAAPRADPVDEISSSMKSVKITFITKEQRVARERERAEREQAEQERIERENATPVLLPADAVVRAEPVPDAPSSPIQAPSIAASSSVADSTHSDLATPAIPPSASSIDTTFTIPDLPPLVDMGMGPPTPKVDFSRQPVMDSPMGSEGFSPAGRIRPGSISTPSSIPQPKWMIPPSHQLSMSPSTDNTSPPSPTRRSEIPVFTSNSAIPFASRRSTSTRSSPSRDGSASGLVRAQAARIAALEAAAAGQAIWGDAAGLAPTRES